ncbi:MAG: PorP/SprF family type IX secretion system membrane protein [Flavobacteriales bacterium]|nr:PorP/SprF family type IX secretion system membrane protein [Flavobacteriales bacterium]
MRKFTLTAVVAALSLISTAQQDPQFTNWFYDKLSFNPAAAGMRGDCGEHCFSMFFRDQWDGFDRDPKTMLFNYNGQFPKAWGLGFTYMGDRLGQERNSIFRISGAYHHQMGSNFLAGGLAIGQYAKKLGDDWVFIDEGDALIPQESKADGTIDLSFGATFYQPGKYYFGLSSTHLAAGELKDLNIKTARHYYVMAGGTFAAGSTLDIRPNILAKSDFNANAFDINVNVLWNKMLYGGVSFRPGDAIAPMVGIEYDLGCNRKPTSQFCQCIRGGYSYDVTLSDIADYSAGSHEFFVTYCFTFKAIELRPIHGNPRRL